MNVSKKNLLWLEFALTPEVQPRHVRPLIEAFGDIENIFAADHLALAGRGGISPGAAAGLSQHAGREAAERELKLMEKHSIALLTYESPTYPPLLRQIPDPPPVLYCLGSLVESDSIAVAIVGTRHPSAYGSQTAHRLAGDIAQYGATVVSGMAYGIDQAAHNGALAAGGRTIAVLGGGMGKIYPAGSAKLVERISEHGAVITEFPYSLPPGKGTFPQRNRIVSGISYSTLVVEAGERSGALITARLALEQNRELLAVPGPIYSKHSLGPNYLIKTGAKLVQQVEDIVEELPVDVRERLFTPAMKKEKTPVTEEEELVLSALSVDTPLHIDIIAGHLGMNFSNLSLVLLGLEMKSLVKQLPGMEYVKAI